MSKTASSLGRHDNTTLQLEESSETLCATLPPYRISAFALLWSRSYAASLKPDSSNLRAIGRPIYPIPTNPSASFSCVIGLMINRP